MKDQKNQPKLHRSGTAGYEVQTLFYEPKIKSSKRHYIPPLDKLRELARADFSGGRVRCSICGYTVSASFARMVRKGNFAEPDWACRYCIKTHDLVIA